MMSLKIMGLNLGPLVRALFLFSLNNPLVMLMNLFSVLTILLIMFLAWVLYVLFE